MHHFESQHYFIDINALVLAVVLRSNHLASQCVLWQCCCAHCAVLQSVFISIFTLVRLSEPHKQVYE